MADHDSDYDSEGGDVMTQEQRDANLIQAVKENNYEQVEELLLKQASPCTEVGGWNPLLWASCNGNEDIVRILIKNNAHTSYINQQQDVESADKLTGDDDTRGDPFVKPKDAQKVGKYTPMHWASYKGHYKVVWILLKAGISPLEIDMHGNTSVHQAASDELGIRVLKCFLSQGCDIGLKNARGHTPLDLATTEETRQLITRAFQTLKCTGKNCGGSKFDFKNIRFYCESCTNFFCGKCATRSWVFEDNDSEVPERPICRCTNCKTKVEQAEHELSAAMETQDFATVHKVLSGILSSQLDIDVRLKYKAEVLHLKLEKELDIRNFIQSVAHVDKYKTIMKSVKILNEKQKHAKDLGVILDEALEEQINQCTSRLTAERNLRFQMDNTEVMAATRESIEELGGLIQDAQAKNVEQEYMTAADQLSKQMNGNLDARDTYALLDAYPDRVYPEPEPLDKNGKPLKKDKNEKPKKKKKEPPFPTPDWAVELDKVVAKVKTLQLLVQDAKNLKLDKEFLIEVDGVLKRFQKEIAFRKQQDEEARLEAEAKALAKKKAAAKKK